MGDSPTLDGVEPLSRARRLVGDLAAPAHDWQVDGLLGGRLGKRASDGGGSGGGDGGDHNGDE